MTEAPPRQAKEAMAALAAKADSLLNLIAETRKKMDTEIFNHLADVKNLCKNDDQRKAFNDFIDNFGNMPPQGPPHMHEHGLPPPPPKK